MEPPGGGPARWLPTHVQVTVLQARGLRGKGTGGSSTSDAYTVIQVGREKYSTSVVEKSTGCPEWREECVFELAPGALDGLLRAQDAEAPDVPGPGPEPACLLVLTAMHRSLIGIDKFLGQATVPLDQVFRQGRAQHTQWYKLHSKAGKKEKERGEIQVGVQFTRNPLSASMFDLSAKDKARSPFGKLKDKVKGKKRFELESASAIVPGCAALDEAELPGKKAKAKTFFLRNKLRKSSLTQSNTSLGSDSTLSSASGSLAWPGPDYLTRSPSRHSRLSTDGGRDSAPSPKLLTHKRAYSDEVSQVQAGQPRAGHDAVSGSSLCINGSHVYGDEPPALAAHRASISGPLHGLSLRRAEEGTGPPDTGPWARGGHGGSAEKLAAPSVRQEEAGVEADAGRAEGKPVQVAAPMVVAPAEKEEPRKEERKARGVGLFHHHHHVGRRGSFGEKMGPSLGASPDDRGRSGWFGSREAKEHPQKPSLDVSPQVEPGPAVPAPPPPPGSPPCSPPAPRMLSANPAPAAAPPAPRGLGATNPFLPSLQSNPFFEELLADTALKHTSPARSLPSGSLAAALPPWDDAFDALAVTAGRPPPHAGGSAWAAEPAPSGGPRTPEGPEDPRGRGGGPAPDLEAAGARSPDGGRSGALAGPASPVARGPGPSSSASWHCPSWDPEAGETLLWGPAPPSPPRRASRGQGGSPGPGPSEEPEGGPGGARGCSSTQADVITDIWLSEMVSGAPGPESPPPIPRRNWEREGSLWGAPEAAPPLEPPDSPGSDLPGGVAPLPEEPRPGSPPPKPPRLFTPSNSQSEDQEASPGEPQARPEDAFLSLLDLGRWEEMLTPGTESGLEKPDVRPSEGRPDQCAAEGTSGPLLAPPDEPGTPSAPRLEQDPLRARDEDDAGSFSSPRQSPASTCLPALLAAGEDAAREPASPGRGAPPHPSLAPPLPSCPATNGNGKAGQEAPSVHGSRPLPRSTPDSPETRELPSPIEGGAETPPTPLALLPLETRPAEERPSQRGASPHPVKPLSTAPPEAAADKKPPRSGLSSALTSGLEKLKTVTSGGVQPAAPQADHPAESKGKLKDPSQPPDQAAKYYHLTHDELIALLTQRERELSRRDEHVHELESYIDQLLVRIMDTSPTLLQIPAGPRGRPK